MQRRILHSKATRCTAFALGTETFLQRIRRSSMRVFLIKPAGNDVLQLAPQSGAQAGTAAGGSDHGSAPSEAEAQTLELARLIAHCLEQFVPGKVPRVQGQQGGQVSGMHIERAAHEVLVVAAAAGSHSAPSSGTAASAASRSVQLFVSTLQSSSFAITVREHVSEQGGEVLDAPEADPAPTLQAYDWLKQALAQLDGSAKSDLSVADAQAAVHDALQGLAALPAASGRTWCVILPAGAAGASALRAVLLRASSSAELQGVTNDAACMVHLRLSPEGAATVVEQPQPPLWLSPTDWFNVHKPVWERLLLPLRDSLLRTGAPMRMLELGSWEGRSAVWLAQNMLAPFVGQGGEQARGSRLVCVDHCDLLRTDAGAERRAKLQYNLYLAGLAERCSVMADFTVPALTELLRAGSTFDFVYIDASHTRSDTLLDAMLAWRMVERGGVVIFDDYEWPNHARTSPEHPAEGIDAFVSAHREDLQIVHCGYQLAVQRTAPAFCGFEWRDATEERLSALTAEGGAMWRGRM